MSSNSNDLRYVKQLLEVSEKSNGYPVIYVLWGCLVFAGFAIAEFQSAWLTTYWLMASPAGFVLSAWLGMRGARTSGQADREQGNRYMLHFGLMVGFIFVAIFTQEVRSILLLIGLGHCLAGIYLERLMLAVGILSTLIYLAIYFSLVSSNLLVGTVFALGFFATAWGAAKQNAKSLA